MQHLDSNLQQRLTTYITELENFQPSLDLPKMVTEGTHAGKWDWLGFYQPIRDNICPCALMHKCQWTGVSPLICPYDHEVCTERVYGLPHQFRAMDRTRGTRMRILVPGEAVPRGSEVQVRA